MVDSGSRNHNWENWQKSWTQAVLEADSEKSRAKYSKAALKAIDKADGEQLFGLHDNVDLDRVRDYLKGNREHGPTIMFLSLILCDASDPLDSDFLLSVEHIKKTNDASKNSKFMKDALLGYASRCGLGSMLISDFERLLIGPKSVDYRKEIDDMDQCEELWNLINPVLAVDDEGFDYLFGKMNESCREEVTDRWFKLVQRNSWSSKLARARALRLLERSIDGVVRPKGRRGEWQESEQYWKMLVMGSISCLSKYPADKESLMVVSDGFFRLEDNYLLKGYLRRFLPSAHEALHGRLLAYNPDPLPVLAFEYGSDEKKIPFPVSDTEQPVLSGQTHLVVDQALADKIAEPLIEWGDVALEARSLYIDVLKICSRSKFIDLIKRMECYIRDADVRELLEILMHRTYGPIKDEDRDTGGRITRTLRESKFFLSALKDVKGSNSRAILDDFYDGEARLFSDLIGRSVVASRNTRFEYKGASRWLRPPPDLESRLGFPKNFDESMKQMVQILQVLETSYPPRDRTRALLDVIEKEYRDTDRKKVVLLEAVHRSKRPIERIKKLLIDDLEDFNGHPRILKFTLVNAAMQYMGDERVIDLLISELDDEITRGEDRAMGLLLGIAISRSSSVKAIERLDTMIPLVQNQEALKWSLEIIRGPSGYWSQNIETALLWGVDRNSITSLDILRNHKFRTNLSKSGARRIEGRIYDDHYHAYLKCQALRAVNDNADEDVIHRMISLFELGDMVSEARAPIQSMSPEEQIHKTPIFGLTTEGTSFVPANLTLSLMWALSSTPKEPILQRLRDPDMLVRYGCAAVLATRSNLSDHPDVRPILNEMRRSGILGNYGLEFVEGDF